MPKLAKWDNVGSPAWSHDSRYLYFMNRSSVYRVRTPDGGWEVAADTSGTYAIYAAVGWPGWFGLTPDDRILVLEDRGSSELYALDLEYR